MTAILNQSGTQTECESRAHLRLSEVTRHLVKPTGMTGSYWPAVKRICRDDLGIEFDGWQEGAANLILAHRDNGKLAHTVGGVGMSLVRQCGKSFLLSGLIFSLCIYRPNSLIIWSAHHSATHMETFMAMQGFAKRTQVAPFISKVYKGSGDEEVRFHNGSRILFGARERGFGRGIPGVDALIMDEGQILSQRAMQNMLATMNTSQLGLHIYCGTPPYPEDNSENFVNMRDEALSGESKDLLWIECGADPSVNIDDPANWLVNPSYPHRTPMESIQRMRKKLNEEGFKREGLGIWPVNDGSAFDLDRWAKLADMEVETPDQVVLMIDVSPDRRWSSIGVAGQVDDRVLLMVQSIKGTSDVVPAVQQLMEDHSIVEVVIFGGGSARVLEPALVEAGIEYEKMTAGDMSAAYGALQEAIKDGTVTHVDQPQLNLALMETKTRFVQTGESESFDRRGQHVDVSPAVAAAGALYRFGLQLEPMPILL